MTKTVAVIDARTYRIVRRFAVGREPQHVTTFDKWLVTRGGRALVVTAVDSGDLIRVDLGQRRVAKVIHLGGMPVDVKLAPDGRSFFVANQALGGVWTVDARSLRETGFIHTGAGAHGLALGSDGRRLYVANRAAGTIGVIDLARRRLVATWRVGGSPDGLQSPRMGANSGRRTASTLPCPSSTQGAGGSATRSV
jgi:YVTN family beta-propeller protein